MRSEEEKLRVLSACHASSTGMLLRYVATLDFLVYNFTSLLTMHCSFVGGHLGCDKILEKDSSGSLT